MNIPRKKTVTVVLNGYKRQISLAEQLESLALQSFPVDRIMYWNLKSNASRYQPDYQLLAKMGVETAETSHDYGVWGRFSFALNSNSDFICMMDDDIVPGQRYIENCMACYEKQAGIYGTLGSAFSRSTNELMNFGWKECHNPAPVHVNYLYQTWFMPRKALNAFWSEPVAEHRTQNRHMAEDIHLSLMAQTKLGLKTFVAPHPIEEPQLWGNIAKEKYGLDIHAVHLKPEMQVAMKAYLDQAFSLGLEKAFTDRSRQSKMRRLVHSRPVQTKI